LVDEPPLGAAAVAPRGLSVTLGILDGGGVGVVEPIVDGRLETGGDGRFETDGGGELITGGDGAGRAGTAERWL
jgi:hypothetical protein